MDFIECSTTTIDHKKFLLRRISFYIRKKNTIKVYVEIY